MNSSHLALKEMLLIEEPSILAVKDGIARISNWFILPAFASALAWEYFGDLKFGEVVKRLILVLVFMGAFYSIHKEGVEICFKGSEELLREVSPRNVFLRRWTEIKVRTNEDKMSKSTGWGTIERFVVPNLNDLIGTFFFLLSKLLIWILKLVYSTVYHLTYIFAPFTAILYFFPITRGSISGSIVSSLWCMLLPFVLVALLAIVGNSFQGLAGNGELVVSSMDQILWLFGITLLIAATPVFTLGLLKGGGMAMSGTAASMLLMSAGSKVASALPVMGYRLNQLRHYGVKKFFGENENPIKEKVTPKMREMEVMRPVENFGHRNESTNTLKTADGRNHQTEKSMNSTAQSVRNEKGGFETFKRSESTSQGGARKENSNSQNEESMMTSTRNQRKTDVGLQERSVNKDISNERVVRQSGVLNNKVGSISSNTEMKKNKFDQINPRAFKNLEPRKTRTQGPKSNAYYREVENKGTVYETRDI